MKENASDRSSDVPKIVFSHIPKTAGTTLRHIIQYQFHPSEVFEFYRYNQLLDKGISKFINLPDRKKEKIRFISGHLGFGLHSLFPDCCSYITVLRHPIDRILSYYSHLIRTGKESVKGKAIEDFVLSFGGVRNSMVCNLAGYTFRAQMNDPSLALEQVRYSPRTLELAIENLKRYFSVVGILEQFDETCLLLQKVLGWDIPIGHLKSNRASRRAKLEEIPEQTLGLLRKHNELDLQLYEYAKLHFSRQVEEQGSEFVADLNRIRSLEDRFEPALFKPEKLLLQTRSYCKRISYGINGLLE
ncbi:MAG: sulfotransferase family 2 domain-containing protein [Cyanobacteria bacterium P01_A01_bin.17]